MSIDETKDPVAKAHRKAPPRSKQTNRLIPWALRPGNTILVSVQEMFNRFFTPTLNPLYYLGAITFLLFWVVLASGIYLFLFYDMSSHGAYESVRHITQDQKYYGGIMRSLHRYASDGLVIVILIHMAQVFFSDRFRRYRWVAWVTGVVIIPIIWFEGISGYVLVWDQAAQVMALIFADILDILPINSEPIPSYFLTNESVHMLFFVLNYLHVAIPFLLLIMAWVHCMRISMPLINPPRQVTVVILLSLLGLSLVKPAVSGAPADLSTLVGQAPVDWFFVPFFPLVSGLSLSPEMVWVYGGIGFALFTCLPWLVPEPKKHKQTGSSVTQCVVNVDLESCKGCVLCQQACPFEAMKVVPRTDGEPYEQQAEVVPTRCAECGFCVNACEFNAVSMGEWSKSAFQDHIESLLQPESSGNGSSAKPSVIVFVCERSFDQEKFFNPKKTRLAHNEEIASMTIPCIGVVSPAIVDYSISAGAKGIIVVGCRGLDCHYREARRRLAFTDNSSISYRFLVEKMDEPNVKIMLVSPFDVDSTIKEIDEFNELIKSNNLA